MKVNGPGSNPIAPFSSEEKVAEGFTLQKKAVKFLLGENPGIRISFRKKK